MLAQHGLRAYCTEHEIAFQVISYSFFYFEKKCVGGGLLVLRQSGRLRGAGAHHGGAADCSQAWGVPGGSLAVVGIAAGDPGAPTFLASPFCLSPPLLLLLSSTAVSYDWG